MPPSMVSGRGGILGIGQNAGVHAVEAAVIAGHIAGGLGDGGILKGGHHIGAHPQGDLGLAGGIGEDLAGVVAGLQVRDRVAGVEGHAAAAGRRGGIHFLY